MVINTEWGKLVSINFVTIFIIRQEKALNCENFKQNIALSRISEIFEKSSVKINSLFSDRCTGMTSISYRVKHQVLDAETILVKFRRYLFQSRLLPEPVDYNRNIASQDLIQQGFFTHDRFLAKAMFQSTGLFIKIYYDRF